MFNQRLIHLDLKGGQPKIDYLIKLLPIFKSLGATGLLIEYEDTFPYTGALSILKDKNHYTENELRKLFEACILNKLIVIPLIQSLGHVEFILKHICFKHLRETPQYPNVICVCNDKSSQLICNILEQIITLHSKYIDIQCIHLGCDEVYFLANCNKCQNKLKQNQSWPKEYLFLDYVSKLANHVQTNYSLNSIIWDDMIRNVNTNLIEQSNLHKNVQLMIWHYTDLDNFGVLDSQELWSKYLKLFDNIWIATAFKGASAVDAILPPIQYHIKNHLAWNQIIKKHIESNSNYRRNLIGITLTGWSRFDHLMTLCELLPNSIPSLACCLQVIQNNNCFNEETHHKSSQLLAFNTLIPFDLTFDLCNQSLYANFPGFILFSLSIKLMQCIVLKKELFRHPSLKGGFTSYAISISRINPLHINSFLNNAKLLQLKFENLLTNFENELKQIFYEDTVKEFIIQNIRPHLNKLNKLIQDCDQQLVINEFKDDNLIDK